jgi:spermidine/putrescine-binding protein
MKKSLTKTWLGRGMTVAAMATAVALSVPASASAAVRVGSWQQDFNAARADLDAMSRQCEDDGGTVNKANTYVDSGSGFRANVDCSVW